MKIFFNAKDLGDITAALAEATSRKGSCAMVIT